MRSLSDEDLVDRIGHLRYRGGFEKLVAALAEWVRMVQELAPSAVEVVSSVLAGGVAVSYTSRCRSGSNC